MVLWHAFKGARAFGVLGAICRQPHSKVGNDAGSLEMLARLYITSESLSAHKFRGIQSDTSFCNKLLRPGVGQSKETRIRFGSINLGVRLLVARVVPEGVGISAIEWFVPFRPKTSWSFTFYATTNRNAVHNDNDF